jgi:hypothetical protein
MGIHGNLWEFLGFWGDFMGIYGSFWDFGVILWDLMRGSWDFMGVKDGLRDFLLSMELIRFYRG